MTRAIKKNSTYLCTMVPMSPRKGHARPNPYSRIVIARNVGPLCPSITASKMAALPTG